jgi:poly-gamma-glutamate capsule biosynthesis protein CapA/YwtB (metallophosphatase superfamily)
MAERTSFTAVGDCFITRRAPNGDPALADLAAIISKNDVRLANLEVSLNDGNVYPSAICGGTWSEAHPDVLQTLGDYGFNVLGWANNHTLDYLHDGVLSTKFYLEQAGFIHAGAGENLYEASTPKYLETVNGRVALISCATTAPADWIAGEQRNDSIGRPGLNLLRTTTVYNVISDNHSAVTAAR